MRREVPIDRVLFAALLGVSLLLLSLAMLRSDMAEPAAATHTFRDGFIVADRVADRVERRTETATPAGATQNATAPESRTTAAGSSLAPQLRREDAAEDATKPPAAAAAIHVSGADAHTTTIKMEGGDEITIKRAANSKNKVTTISTHEDGKITIENRDTATTAAAATPATPAPSKQPGGVPTSLTPIPSEPGKKRSVDFVGEYDASEKARGLDATDADPPAATSKPEEKAGDADAEEAEATPAGDNTHEIVVGKKKVTVVNVGRSETKVSLSDVDETQAAKAETLQTSSR